MSADEFTSTMLAKFGLNGSNNCPVTGLLPAVASRPSAAEKVLSGVTYGYDGGVNNFRNSLSSVFWIEYQPVKAAAARDFGTELDRFLLRVADEFGRISVSGTGNALSHLLTSRAARLGLDVQQNVLVVPGHPGPTLDETVPVRIKETSITEIDEFAVRFVTDTHCHDPWCAFEAMHGFDDTRFHLFGYSAWTVFDYGYDERQKSFIGPPMWALLDFEKYTAIDRWCQIHGLPGTDCVLRSTPELIASQFGSAPFNNWLQTNSARTEMAPAALNDWTWLIELIRSHDPDMPPAAATYDASHGLEPTMKELRRKLRKLKRVRPLAHTTPLWCLFEQLRLNLPRELDGRLLYGAA
jgi:hypothetical protein